MDKWPYLLVAERSVLPVIDLVIESLERRGNPASIHVIVPGPQLREFGRTRCVAHQLVAEERILPSWPLARVASLLPRRPYRAGWYLQQFLKLGFGLATGVPRYVIWDADTVMLATPRLWENGQVLINAAREYHAPYFATFERLLGRPATLPKSVISQYMPIDTPVAGALRDAIENRHHREWIEAVLAGLPQESNSEFSEYETYANFLEGMHPGMVKLVNEKWFRYGTQVLPDLGGCRLPYIDRRFRGYGYVAFERRRVGLRKVARARLLWLLGVSAGP